MSVDTLFDYLESAEGSGDLDAITTGALSVQDAKRLCEAHNLADSDVIRLGGICALTFIQVELEALDRIATWTEPPDAR